MRRIPLLIIALMTVATIQAFTGTPKNNATDLSLYEKTALISEKYLGIRQQVPKGYTRENLKEFKLVILNCNSEQLKNNKPKYGYAYYEFADSKDGESKLLYPFFSILSMGKNFLFSRENMSFKEAKRQTLGEIQAAQSGGLDREELYPASHWGEQMQILGGEEARKWGQADSVFITDIKLDNPFQERYTHCICINMAKEGYAPLYIKLMLTDKGYAEKEKRMKAIRNCLSYLNSPWEYNIVEIKKPYGIR